MEQTFRDLCNERTQQTERRLAGFMLGVFVDTAIGIGREHALLIREGDAMRTITTDVRSAALGSFILVLPLIGLELFNRRSSHEGFPIPLFGFLWVLPTAFIVLLVPIVRSLRAGNSITANPVNLFFKVAALAVIAAMWGAILADQIPCFLGVPNCD